MLHLTLDQFIGLAAMDTPVSNYCAFYCWVLHLCFLIYNIFISLAAVDLLLQHGVDLDVRDSKGCSPLIIASQYGHAGLAGYLIGKGAGLHLVDRDGDTALHWAAFKGVYRFARIVRTVLGLLLAAPYWSPQWMQFFRPILLDTSSSLAITTSISSLLTYINLPLGLPLPHLPRGSISSTLLLLCPSVILLAYFFLISSLFESIPSQSFLFQLISKTSHMCMPRMYSFLMLSILSLTYSIRTCV